ncbi:MAG: type II toxin-antitoxin system HicA family toxin [Candidatus Acidiferrales bacterium]
MPKLPVLSGSELVKILAKIGYELDHQTGSHRALPRPWEPVCHPERSPNGGVEGSALYKQMPRLRSA